MFWQLGLHVLYNKIQGKIKTSRISRENRNKKGKQHAKENSHINLVNFAFLCHVIS